MSPGKSGTGYAPPTLESVGTHFSPDNSGSCCPICGDGLNDSTQCDLCPASRLLGDEQEDRISREWFGPERWDFAVAVPVPNGGPALCHDDVYPVRDANGTGRMACYVCIDKSV